MHAGCASRKSEPTFANNTFSHAGQWWGPQMPTTWVQKQQEVVDFPWDNRERGRMEARAGNETREMGLAKRKRIVPGLE
jgi:hypothetical protein